MMTNKIFLKFCFARINVKNDYGGCADWVNVRCLKVYL